VINSVAGLGEICTCIPDVAIVPTLTMNIVCSLDAEQPYGVEMVSLTVRVPAEAKVCTGDISLEVVPSPKSH